MRLKTKLVLAISALVFLIAGLVSLVYVHQLVKTAVRQTYDTNWSVARQVRFALQNALESGLRDRTVDPNNPGELQELVAETVRNDAQLQAALVSVNRYYLTVYDVNIGDSQGMTLLSTNPDNEGKPLPSRPNYAQAAQGQSLRMIAEAFRSRRVYDVVAPLENNGKLFATVNVGVHTSLLRAVYEPLLRNALRLMALALIVALAAAFLLSNLALRPLTQISRQLDRLTAAEGVSRRGQSSFKKGCGGAGLDKDREDRPAHAQRGRGLLRIARESRPDSRQFAGRHSALHRRQARRAGFRSCAPLSWHRPRQRSGPAPQVRSFPALPCWAGRCARPSTQAPTW